MRTGKEKARMSENERKDRIETLKRQIFILDMKDNWDSVDYADMRRMQCELRELEREDHD